MTIDEVLELQKEVLANEYKALVKKTFAELTEAHGVDLKGIYNTHDAGVFKAIIRKNIIDKLNPTPLCGSPTRDKHYIIDEVALDKSAKHYADSQIDGWRAKLLSKVGNLHEALVTDVANGTFYVIGKNDSGKQVRVYQQTVLKFSSKGMPYQQFPQRIYVDGEFYSAAKYKKEFLLDK